VSGFVFSRDNKLLLGPNRSVGVYKDFLVVPAAELNLAKRSYKLCGERCSKRPV